jgi:hypothetical protein
VTVKVMDLTFKDLGVSLETYQSFSSEHITYLSMLYKL